ncbi:AraC family transcriptional regulator [Kordia sp. YSTF-M3]|uniref:AraC family transcriptional regulator n=1 Tax=Kordia aestuariivivens TaxID=2759037 RepID=A0ABR7Q9S5_9FLAO|nr:helix-turn-helix domain-containing protein [Kordia aestuariivivens]MBC8755168.1 AraC family transcriptional regulator [Kordia aestuariivivens]
MKDHTQNLISFSFVPTRKYPTYFQLSIICILFGITSAFSQVSSDTFEAIKSDFDASSQNSEEALNAATLFLAKAKEINDVARIVEGYELFVSNYSHTAKAIFYTDSIILLTKNTKLDNYPAEGYLKKGIQLYYNSKYNDALNNFATANDMALTSKNIKQQISIKHYIGLLKNVSEEREEALKIFQDNIGFIRKNNFEDKDPEQYLKSLFALADSYNKNRVLDSAEVVHQRGIKASLQHPNQYLYPWFLTSYGITSYYKENYATAMDSLLKATDFLKNNEKTLCSNYLYIYKCLEKQGKNTEGLRYLYKVDSIYEQKPKVIFQARDAYEFLNAEHKAANDAKQQLSAIEKLLVVDEIITERYQNLGKKIVQKYETPLIISETEELLIQKEELISQLQDKNFLSEKKVFVLIIVSVLLVFIIFYFFRRNVVYKKRFNSLMEEYEQKKVLKEKEKEEKKKVPSIEKIPASETQKEAIGLPKEIVDGILVKLQKFEDTHRFTKKNYTQTKLAKELDTNSTYLSKIINMTKGMNFANYMNELRIDYAITQLKEDKVFRSYTIKAIAMDVGFNNAQSFSIAFHKKTGINPSYFLKQLENQKSISNN